MSPGCPYIVMGASSLVAALLLVCIPETKGLCTLETNNDVMVIEEQREEGKKLVDSFHRNIQTDKQTKWNRVKV